MRPNFDFSPPLSFQRPNPRTAGLATKRRHAHLVRDLEQHVDLAELLDHDVHLVAELLPHEGEAHELLVLVAVADDQMLGVLGEAEDGLELGLAPAFEADAASLAEFDDLFDDVALLVDLDRVDGRVAAGVAELLARLLEPRREVLDPRAQNVREAQQHRERDPLLLEIVRDLVQVHRAVGAILVRPHDDVPFVVHVEESGAPPLDSVQRSSGVDRPSAGRRVAGWRGGGRAVRRSARPGGSVCYASGCGHAPKIIEFVRDRDD